MTQDTPDVDRRNVMKGLGAAALGGLALAATSGGAAASVGTKPADLKIQWAPFVDTSNIDNKPSYNLAFGFKLKDESASYDQYTAYGFFKLYSWGGYEREIPVGPIVLDSPASKQIIERLSLRDFPERWYRATATLLVVDNDSGEIAYLGQDLETFKFEK
jgi:hypothetical protein